MAENGILARISRIVERARAAQRAFVLGPGVVEPFEQAFGHPTDTFSPEEYGNYIATSGAVYACATTRAGMLCGLPVVPYKMVKGKKTKVESGALYELLQKVNPYWTMRRLLEMSELSLCLWGKAFWFLERGENGRQAPKEIWWGKPDRVRVVTDEMDYISKFLYYPIHGATPLEFDPWEVIWFRYANPLDEFEGLSPVAAARLAADLRNSALKSNKGLFDRGMQIGGAVFPKQGATLSPEQAGEIERTIDTRHRGVDKAHRWSVFRYEFEMKEFGINSRDAEFLGTLSMTLEEVARAYKIPLDFIGGQRTYENVEASERAIWTRCLKPEAEFMADEMTEQLAPMFPAEADLVEIDLSGVEALQESENASWTRDNEKIERGVITINEWREDQGLDPVAWGDVWWAQGTLVPVEDAAPMVVGEAVPGEAPGTAVPVTPAPEAAPTMPMDHPAASTDAQAGRIQVRSVAGDFGSEAHQRIWNRFVTRAGQNEKKVGKVVADLFKRQEDSILAGMRSAAQSRGVQAATRDANEPFNRTEWVKRFRETMRPVIKELVRETGQAAFDDLVGDGITLTMAFQVTTPAVKRFIERRAQRFAEEVNATTWDALKVSLGESIQAGESLTQQMERVQAVMAERIRSSSETIARTEVVGAMNGGTLEAWRQSDVVSGKEWVASLDNRTRASHADAHGQQVGIEEDFIVGAGRGQAPGQIGLPEEDIECRCTLAAVIKE